MMRPPGSIEDKAVSEFAKSVMPKVRVSLHCHEFGVFYALARLKKMGVPVRTVATLHATVPGRTAGYKALQKIASERFPDGARNAFGLCSFGIPGQVC